MVMTVGCERKRGGWRKGGDGGKEGMEEKGGGEGLEFK